MFIQKNFHPDSVGQFEALAARGHQVRAIVQYASGAKSGKSSSSLQPEELGYGPLSRRFWRKNKKRLDMRGAPKVTQLYQILRRERPDVVIAREIRTVSMIALYLSRLFGARTVLSWEKPKRARKSWLLAAGGGLLLPRRKIHRGHFGEVGRDLRLGGLLGHSRLLPYPVRPHPTARPRAESSDRVKIVAIGSLDNSRKRMSWLSKAVASAGINNDVALTYIGLGTEESLFFREIRDLEQEHGVAPATILLNLPHSEVIERLPRFDLFVHPARNEPFGAVVPEAMAAGLPVICSSTCGSRACFENEVSGLVFSSDSFEDFTASVVRLVQDRELRHAMADAAFDRVQNVLNPERWAEMLEDLVEER